MRGWSTYLGEVFEGSECTDVALAVEHGNGEVGSLDQLEHTGVGVDTIVDVVLADRNQVNDLVGVIGVGSAKDEALVVEVLVRVLLFVSFKFWVHEGFQLYYNYDSKI